MGIGRFAFTPLLPMMQADAGVSIGQGGWLATANYVGYFAGSLWAAAQRVRTGVAIRAGLLVIGLATLAMGMTETFAAWLVLRFTAGVASAWVLIHVSSWCLERLAPLGKPLLGGVVYAGVGSGIMAAGLLCVALMVSGAASSAAWLILGCLAMALAVALWPQFKQEAERAASREGRSAWTSEWVRLVVCYGAYGLGYIIPATFLPAMARDSLADPSLFGWAWPLFGAAAIASTLAVAALPRRYGNRRIWVACHLVMALGVLGPFLLPGLPGILLASVCVGGTFVVITMVGLQEAQRIAGSQSPALIAAMTAAFAAGQIAGPALVAIWVRQGGTLAVGLAAAGAVLIASAALLGQKGRTT